MPIFNTEYKLRPNAIAIELDKSFISLTTVWQTEQLAAILTPSGATNPITWSSSDTTVATVSQTWLVTCVTPWTCTITATTDNWLSATCSVWQWWEPWANTLSYLPLSTTTTTTDYGTAWWTWTQYWWTFIGNYYQVSTSDRLYTTQNAYSALTEYTMMCWVEIGSNWFAVSSNNYWNWDNGNILIYWGGSERYNGGLANISYSMPSWRHHVAITWQSWILYVDWVQVGTNSYNIALKPYFAGINSQRSGSSSYSWDAKYSKFILENKVWTAQEISDYYNQTKGDYWIS